MGRARGDLVGLLHVESPLRSRTLVAPTAALRLALALMVEHREDHIDAAATERMSYRELHVSRRVAAHAREALAQRNQEVSKVGTNVSIAQRRARTWTARFTAK